MASPDLPSLHAIGSRLRFRQLRLLIAIDESGSLHRAAETLSVSQPGASKALREIEDTFGAELFARHPHGLEANDLGRCVVRYARLIGQNLDHLREELSGIIRGEGGRVAVGAIAGAWPTVLVNAVHTLKRQQPAISVELFEDTSARLLEMLSEGRLDMAICRISVAAQPELFDSDWLSDERVGIAVGYRHPLASASKVDLAQVVKYPWVTFPSHMPMRTLLERELIEAGLTFPAHAIETSSTFASMLLLLNSEDLVALFTTETLQVLQEHRLVKRLPLHITSRVEPYGIVTRRGSFLSPSAKMLMGIIKDFASMLDGRASDLSPASSVRPHAQPGCASSIAPVSGESRIFEEPDF